MTTTSKLLIGILAYLIIANIIVAKADSYRDTSITKVVEIEITYDFGFAQKNIVTCTYIYFDSYKSKWYCKGINQDFWSDIPPKILRTIKD